MDIDQISEDSIFKIGKVISVDGRLVTIKVDKTKNTSHLLYKGELLRNVSVGGYLKIIKGFTEIIGKVDGEFTNEERQFAEGEYASGKDKINRTLGVKLLGFFDGRRFERGIKELPLIDNECFLLHVQEFNQIHNFVRAGDEPITIGTLALEKGQRIEVGVNSLFASHIGIFGNTGSGKSYTLAKIYHELFEKYKDRETFTKNANFVLIDFNGEYIDADDDIIVAKKYKNIFKLSTRTEHGGDKFPIAAETLNDPDFWFVFLEATVKTQQPFLRRAVADDGYVASRIGNETDLRNLITQMLLLATTKEDWSLEKGVVINFLSELKDCLADNASIGKLLEDYRSHLQFHSTNSKFYYQDQGAPVYSNQPAFESEIINARTSQLSIPMDGISAIDAIRLRIVIQYYYGIIKGYSNKEHLAPLINRLDKRLDDLRKVVEITNSTNEEVLTTPAKNFTIISLRDVSMQMRKILPLLLYKKLYDQKKTENNEKNYLNLIVDEAHNILSEDSERESEQWKDYRLEVFEEIIKEGRKFGVFLTLASQRPSDISPTIISQLHNYFLHRLINNEDIKAVERTISYLDKVSFEYLPILPTGTCILAGLLANVPVVIDIGKMDTRYEPKNKTRTLADQWQ